ncbi:MAG: HNH endonuclease [Saprospiraceae bacterium]|nr:HNH endonuclease [Saprospiraceae bacterium]
MNWAIFKYYYRTFEVNDRGTVKNENGIILKGSKHRNGFRVLNLRLKLLNGEIESKTLLVHRMVATCFIENPELKPFVIHKDGDLVNNKAENLEWATEEEKIAHQQAIGKFGYSKLSTVDVMKIKKRIKKGDVIQHIANDFNVSHTQIQRIKKGENWI